jgi:cytochrome c556
MKYTLSCASALLMLAMGLPAQAQFAKPEDAIKYRKNTLFVMQQHWARLGAMAQGRVPYDAKLAIENADLVATFSKLPWTAFVEGTDKGDTRSRPEIWKETGKFKEATDKYLVEIQKVQIAAKTGNLDNLKAAFGSAAQTCKACHDNFRKD